MSDIANKMIIREANFNDRESIANFQVAMAKETENEELDYSTVLNGVSAVLMNEEKGRYFIAEIDGNTIASLLITYEWSDWRNGTIYWIQSVFVMPENRGKGVYAGMYSYIKEKVEKSNDIIGIRLYVDKRNTNAKSVYIRLGMSSEHYELFEWLK